MRSHQEWHDRATYKHVHRYLSNHCTLWCCVVWCCQWTFEFTVCQIPLLPLLRLSEPRAPLRWHDTRPRAPQYPWLVDRSVEHVGLSCHDSPGSPGRIKVVYGYRTKLKYDDYNHLTHVLTDMGSWGCPILQYWYSTRLITVNKETPRMWWWKSFTSLSLVVALRYSVSQRRQCKLDLERETIFIKCKTRC